MKHQLGVSLNGLMLGGVFLGLLAMGAMKVAPELIEFGQIKKAIIATASDPALKDASVAKIRDAYSKFAEIDNIKRMPAGDLEITKDGSEIVISFAYTSKIHLFSNVSLVFDFEASSNQK
ncbi:MAG: DUF4845 domain-containing protein [Rhodocyclaceae bacterium]|nr:DUF4845 domain-containing protein [Rhodocyclaceae bacterium]MBP7081004.1 DUF4845 domain-containing protein [Rhodocyclaceae bacterium]